MGAPVGNKNGATGTEWRDAIRHALAEIGRDVDGKEAAYRKGLYEVADKFIEAAKAGEPWAMKEIGDRMDGKPKQSQEISGPGGGDIPVKAHLIFHKTNASSTD